jgi:hypothetical protein
MTDFTPWRLSVPTQSLPVSPADDNDVFAPAMGKFTSASQNLRGSGGGLQVITAK